MNRNIPRYNPRRYVRDHSNKKTASNSNIGMNHDNRKIPVSGIGKRGEFNKLSSKSSLKINWLIPIYVNKRTKIEIKITKLFLLLIITFVLIDIIKVHDSIYF